MVRKRRLWELVTLTFLLGGVLGALGAFPQEAWAARTATVVSVRDSPYQTSSPTTFMRMDAGTTGNVAFCAQSELWTPGKGSVMEYYGSPGIPELDYVLYHGYDGEVVTSLYGMDAERSEAATGCAVWLAVGLKRADILTTTLANGNTLHGNTGYKKRWENMKDPQVKAAAKRLSDEADAYAAAGGGGVEAGCATLWTNPNPSYVNGKQVFDHQALVTVTKSVTVTFTKTSANATITNGNASYGYAGAVYDIHRAADGAKVATITTDGAGKASYQLQPNTAYYAVEVKAPAGFALSKDRVSFTTGGTGGQVTLADTPGTVRLKIRKKDSATEGTAQPGASLSGAAFKAVSHSTPGWSATAITDANGALTFSGVPLGKIEVFETKAPEGYKPLENSLVYTVGAGSLNASGVVELEPENDYREHPIAFDLEITKFLKEDYQGSVIERPGEGIRFDIISNTTGKTVGSIETDADGKATTAGKWFGEGNRVEGIDGALPYDRAGYTIREVKETLPEGFGTVGDWTVSAEQMANGTTLRYIVNNSILSSYLQLVKVDAESGQTVPLAGFTFQVLDESGNPVTQRSWYPNPVDVSEFTTDETGSVTLPGCLKAGTYHVREIAVQPPYLLAGKDIAFKIDPDDHELEPITVIRVANEQAKGEAEITKTCAVDGEALAGAEFNVVAQMDIVSPDGTVHAREGEVIDHVVTDEDGKANAKGLHLGSGAATYAFVETVPAPGHVLDEAPVPFTLTYQDPHTAVVSAHAGMTNEPTTAELDKRVLGTDKPLAGAVFELWNVEDEVTEDTDPDRAPEEEGNRESEPDADEDGDNEVETDTEGELGAETNAPILKPGVKPQRIVTDENGRAVVRHLERGTYRLREVEAPNGYLIDGEIRTITVDDAGRIEGSGSITITVEDDFTKVEITKRDITNEAEVPGAKLAVIDAEGNEIESWISGTAPHRIDALPPGTYTLVEHMTPHTYDQASSVEFTVLATGEIQTVTMYDEPIEITGEIDKRQEIADPTAADTVENGDGANNAQVSESSEGLYEYTLDFRSTSSTWVDEFTVEDDLTAVRLGTATLMGITTPQAHQDFNGLMNVWYRVETVGVDVPDQPVDSDANATLSDGHENPWLTDESARQTLGDDGRALDYTNWRLWKRDVPAHVATHLNASDLPLAENERVVAFRFEYGRVEEGFTTRLGDWDRPLLKDAHDDMDDAPSLHRDTFLHIDGTETSYAPAVVQMRVTLDYTEGARLENEASVHLFRNGGGDELEDHDEDLVVQTPKSRIRELAQTGLTAATILLVIGATVTASLSLMRKRR